MEFAEATFLKRGRSFDQIFAVFDRDDHLRFAEALAVAEARDGKLRSDEKAPVPFRAIPSIPCFELWLLLHFRKVSHRLHRNEVFKTLRTHLPGYEKGHGGHYASTREHLTTAFAHADELAKLKATEGKDFPSTDVPLLVRLLTTLKP